MKDTEGARLESSFYQAKANLEFAEAELKRHIEKNYQPCACGGIRPEGAWQYCTLCVSCKWYPRTYPKMAEATISEDLIAYLAF